ncbi:MAG: tRNA-specific adenosine deaminase [Planctomycetes bacterium]|nr:tRNA-specific adenosine deaminase [Planctomycetota bacterium]
MSPLQPTSEDERWMARCLELAAAAATADEVPVGALVVVDGVVVGEGQNRVEAQRSPLAHAELLAVQAALAAVGQKRLPSAVVYCTLEPCFLCAGALLHARVAKVVFGARDPKFGAVRSLATLLEDPRLNHRCTVVEGVGASASAELLRAFFRAKRG